MIFWRKSITSQKGKIVTQTFPKDRLQVTKCSVGGQPPAAICSLEKPNNCMCPLDIEFGEDDGEVHFYVYGCNFKEATVHLSGFFIDQ
ncbi:hypothetical protein MKW92_007425 [Papaver armeniacum]|nr:hypothetical protein MKW92_007425 [Papaver armeniacum]